jgi:predicted AAA+ superfamily ATPase
MGLPGIILKTRADIAGLSVFSALKSHPLIHSLDALLGALASGALPLDLLRCWARFTEALALPLDAGFPGQDWFGSFHSRVACLTAAADNAFTRQLEAAEPGRLPPALLALGENDLSRLGRIAALDLRSLGAYAAGLLAEAGLGEGAAALEREARALAEEPEGGAPEDLFAGNADWAAALPALGARIRSRGAGDLGLYNAFSWSGGASLRPALRPDPIRPADLWGYEAQRSVVTANTLRFLEGKGANNLLLYGDRGTGKSATVKAVCNEYAPRGLRLIEVRKGDLPELPVLLDALAARAPRFVIFIDDLSFESADDSFTGLKALLEGRVESRPANVVIYATSNRRHLAPERFADRPGLAEAANAASTGEVRAFDAMQEQLSLADRFGLTLVYAAPSQEEYLRIACFIGRRRGVLEAGEEERFRDNALRWERWFNGRSPRTAAQYVEWVAGGAGFPWEM